MKEDADVAQKCVNMFCYTHQFLSIQFCGKHTKSHGVRWLSKYYNMRLHPKTGHVTCTIRQIPCDCAACMSMVDKPFIPGFSPQQQPHYQPETEFIYCPVLVSFKNCNIIALSHKATTGEVFEDIHQVVLDDISANMALLVKYGNY